MIEMTETPTADIAEIARPMFSGVAPCYNAIRKEVIGDCVLYQGDCIDVLPCLPSVDAVISDPPYPNGAGLFLDGVKQARAFMCLYNCEQWLIFWDEMTEPPMPQPLVAKHLWYRTNSNRPDNYELIYHLHADGRKRASRVLPFAVIALGLTGCHEATIHPTQKNKKLMIKLLEMSKAESVVDPFMGSGTTGVACARQGKQFVGIEREPKYFDIACKRIERAYQTRPRLFDAVKENVPNRESLF